MKRFRSHFSVHFCHSFFSCAIVFQSFSPSIIFMFFSQQMHKSAPRGLPSTFLRTRALNKRSVLPYWVWKCIEGTVRGFALLGSQVFIYKHREVEGVWKRCRERKRIRRGLLNIWHKDLRMFRKRERGGARLAFPMLAFCNEQRSQRAGPCRVTQRVQSQSRTTSFLTHKHTGQTISTCYGHSLKLTGSPECRSAKWGFSVLAHSALTTEQMSNAGNFAVLWQITGLSYAGRTDEWMDGRTDGKDIHKKKL